MPISLNCAKRELESIDLAKSALNGFERDIIGYLDQLGHVKKNGWKHGDFPLLGINKRRSPSDAPLHVPRWVISWAPEGWFDQFRAAYARNALDYGWIAGRDRGLMALSSKYATYRREKVTNRQTWLPQAAVYLGTREFTDVQDIRNSILRKRMALIAIAIEVFQLKTGSYPKSLEELAPEYLDSELIYDSDRDASYEYRVLDDRYEIVAPAALAAGLRRTAEVWSF